MANSRRKRYKKRLQVKFWREGDENPHSGYTTNVSMAGMFVATNSPVSPNERVKIEIVGEHGGCVVHGEVVHAARVSPLLTKLRQAGMGVRLLGVDELIGELVGRDRDRLRQDVEFRVDSAMRTGFNEASVPDSSPSPETVAQPDETEADDVAEEASWDETANPLDPTLFSIRFESSEQFLAAFRRELQHGGLFIKTRQPPDVNDEVTVEIAPPTDEPVRLPARVVSRRDPDSTPDSQRPPGINVDFKDLKSALEELNRLREIAQKSSTGGSR